jgi:hypothetical protein
MRFAKIENGQVVRVYGKDPGTPNVLPVERALPDSDPQLEYIRENHWSEWAVYADRVERTYTVTPYDLEAERDKKLARVRRLRKEHETGGFFVNLDGIAVRVGSDPGDQAKVMGAKAYTDENPDALIDWSLGNGQWTQLDATAIKGIANALGAHVQATFSHAKALEDQINAASTLPELWAVDETSGWPGV